MSQLYMGIIHGARSPNKYTDKDATMWKIQAGQLTERGFQQVMSLGEEYQDKRLFDKDGNCIYEKIHIVSSVKERCILSTIAFIKGLCPKNYENILERLFREYFNIFAKDKQLLEAIIESKFTNPFLFDYSQFKKKPDFLFHGHDSSTCPKLQEVEDKLINSIEYEEKIRYFKEKQAFEEVYRMMVDASPSKNFTKENITLAQIKTFYGGFKCNEYEGFNFPDPSQAAVDLMKEVYLYQFYDVHNSQMLQHQSSLTEIFQWIINELNEDVPLSWYSGHDSNQIAILAVLVKFRLQPPFATALEFRVKGDYVNLYYNNAKLNTLMCDTEINCTKDQVIRYLSKYIAQDLNKLCQI
ncbi:hypothetical protein pb186bvf_008724 [Paramecium bursaria]